MRNHRRFVLGATLVALALAAGACGSGEGDGNGNGGDGGGDKGTVTVGVSGAFAENQIVAEMYAQVLENDGFTVERQLDLASREISQPAMENGEIDIAPEYLGSLLLFLDPDATGSANPNDNRGQLRPLLEEKGITLLESSSVNNTNVFVVTQETSDEFGLTAVSGLAEAPADFVLGGPPECPERPFCIPGLIETYGVDFTDRFQPLEFPARVAALEAGEIDVALLFATDAVIGESGWVALDDDGGLQQNEAITPVVRTEVLDANPEVADLLNEVSAALDIETMIELNGRVQTDQEEAADVARDFLEENGLLG